MGCVLVEAEQLIKKKRAGLNRTVKDPAQRAGIKRIFDKKLRGIQAAKRLVKSGYVGPSIITVASGVISAKSIAAARAKSAQKGRPKSKIRPAAKTKRKTTQPVKEKTVQVPEQGIRLDTKPKTTQLKIITALVSSLAAADAFKLRGKTVPKKQTRLRGGIGKAATFIYNKLKNKKRAYTPDVYSLVFGIKAKPKEKITLLKKGRVFTGLERRSAL